MKELNSKVPDIFKDVSEFLLLAQPEVVTPPHQLPPKWILELAHRLIDEEVNKEKYATLAALQMMIDGRYSIEIMAELLDSIIDSIYVLAWTARALSLPFNEAWNEVQKANMAKFPIAPELYGGGIEGNITETVVNGRIVRRNEYGKVQKPEGWKAPDIWGVIYEAWTRPLYDAQGKIVAKPIKDRGD